MQDPRPLPEPRFIRYPRGLMKYSIGVPLGDPAGIGPEIALLAAADPQLRELCRPILFAPKPVLERGLSLLPKGIPIPPLKAWDGSLSVEEAPSPSQDEGEFLFYSDVELRSEALPPLAKISAAAGRIGYDCLQAAAGAALAGRVQAIATAPLHKEALKAAGVTQAGHTEILAALYGLPEDSGLTLFDTLGLRVFFFSRHLSLRAAIDRVRAPALLAFFRRCVASMGELGLSGPLAVAGLNPHCGEHGLFGDEEDREISPAVEAARKEGMDIHGPIGADSVFHQAKEGRYAAVISLYHDQGHIACKTYDFHRTISLTLGLPFLRTSVDHGTAFDIAGSGLADPRSMKQAIMAAAAYCQRRAVDQGAPSRA